LFHVTLTYWPAGSRALVFNTDHPIMRGLGLKAGDAIPGVWAGEADVTYEPQAWNILLRSDRAVTEPMESGLERTTQPAFYHTALMVHRNLRLAVISGESFTNLLSDPKCALFQELYRRTLHYLLDSAVELRDADAVEPTRTVDAAEFAWNKPLVLKAIQYRLPDFIRYDDPLWFRKPAPYAHYVVEGSRDGAAWTILADRTHGPWRGMQTDFFPAAELRTIRLRGVFSNGQPFRVREVKVFRAVAHPD
ncbi:MAG: hypothetical protein ACRETL_11375, partial [Gammaproteobacteria bacterium]